MLNSKINEAIKLEFSTVSIYNALMFADDKDIYSAIIVTDDYLCYKEPKSPYNFFLF